MERIRSSAVPPAIRRKRTSTDTQAFDHKLATEAPDFATLMVKLYGVTNKMADALSAQDEYSSKDINALTALVKALPTLQEAERNHRAKLDDKAPEDMSTEDLWKALQGLEDVEDSEFPLLESAASGSTPSE
jgi:hypothetical protein